MTVRTASGLFALVVLAYIVVIVWFSPLPLLDFPNHLARACVAADLLFRHGAEFGRDFQFHFLFASYLFGDLALAALVQLTGINGAADLWTILTCLALPAATYLYLRATRTSSEVTLLMLFISLYLSTDTFFLMGFFEFKLSIALVLVTLALVELLRRQWSIANFLGYIVLMAIVYLTHLAAIVFIAVAVGVTALWRLRLGKSRIAHEALLQAPVVCLLAWHFIGLAAYQEPANAFSDSAQWRPPGAKLAHLVWDFMRYSPPKDYLILATLAACVGVWNFGNRMLNRGALVAGQVLEPLALVASFLVLYFSLPFIEADASHIDERVLAIAPFFLFLGLLNLSSPGPGPATRTNMPAIALAAVAAILNLGYLAVHFHRESNWLANYRSVVASIPRHTTVLPVYTSASTVPLKRMHVGSYAMLDRGAFIPYLFSGDRGHPMKYFRYVRRMYTPEETWYPSRKDGDVDWAQVAQQYRYLLIMKPFTPARIPVSAHAIAENDAAVLEIIDRAAQR